MDAEVALMIMAGGGLVGAAVLVYLLGELERMKFNEYCLTLEVKNLVAIVKDVQAKQREKDGGENGKGRNETVGVLPGRPHV